jgi:hypothetical protein
MQTKSPAETERRISARFQASRVELQVFHVQTSRGCSQNISRGLLDVSDGGVSAIVGRELRVGSKVWLDLKGEADDQLGGVFGEVRWCEPLSGEGWKAGFRFLHASKSVAEILADAVRAVAPRIQSPQGKIV